MSRARKGAPASGQAEITRDAAFEKARAILGEHFEDFAIVVRNRCPDAVWHAVSDKNWAKGALDEVMGRMYEPAQGESK